MNPDYPSCENKDRVCQNHPNPEACKEDDVTNNLSYRSGYSHGCSDSKVSDTSERYINQPGKGPGYHTNEFMRGYNDGFESCSGEIIHHHLQHLRNPLKSLSKSRIRPQGYSERHYNQREL